MENGSKNKPTHVVKTRDGQGKKATYERIGVAWHNAETGALYVRLHGTQIISEGFTLYPIEVDQAQGGAR